MRILSKVLFTLVLLIVGFIIFKPLTPLAAYSPHSVETNVRNGWSSNYGYKYDNMRNGNNIVYDVYSKKYTSGGYQIVNKNFGNGTQSYLNFQGWAINFGYKHHTSSNHDTYIVARKISGSSGVGTTKIYKTDHINISATEEVEYNNQGSGIWNRCADGATKKDNILDCNMEYNNVGFNAFLPLNELFPDSDQNAGWTLYLVKRVDSHIVYTDLKLPFTFDNKDYSGGKISLSSGINANSLKMIGTNVYRRTGPGSTYSRDGYFTTGANYTRIDASETGTSIWFGVNIGGGTKRWGTSAYWGFNGDRATLSYDAPPKHSSHSMTSYNYKNGNDYWAKPNDQVLITLRQYDQTGNSKNYLRIYNGSLGVDARAWHDLTGSTSHFDHWDKDSNVEIIGANRTEKTSNYASVVWTVNPKTHGHTYDVQYYYTDTANNFVGYNNTGMRLRVDGEAPQHTWSAVQNARYQNGGDYWFKPGDSATIKIQQQDKHSGNAMGYMRLFGNGVDARLRHKFNVDAWNYIYSFGSQDGVWYDNKENPHVPLVSGGREAHSDPTIEQVAYTVNLKTHGHKYSVEYHFIDNVGNTSGDYPKTNKYIGVDGVGPVVGFRNDADTANYTNRGWSNEEIKVRIKPTDAHSGFKQFRYAWTTSTAVPTSWSSWTTSSNLVANKNAAGEWYLHVQAEDNVGNITTTYAGPYKFNSPPVPNFSWNPTTIYNNTSVNFTNSSTDADGHTLTYKWEYQAPGSSTWTQFSTTTNPSGQIFNKKGANNIRLTASDGIDSRSVTKSLTVQNRAPVANFSWSPTTIYNDTTVKFNNSSTDADGDTLTYQWAYQEPGSTTWVNFSTTTDPSKVFNKKGTWNVRLTVSDGTTNHAATKSLTVQNRAPVANFSWSPTTIYNDTTVSFSNSSTDADKDSLTYKWEYQEPNSSTWVSFSTTTNPSKVFNKKGTWDIRLTVSDGTASHSVTKSLTVLNRAPVANFSWSPTTIYNDTTVTFSNNSTDADKDSLTYKWEYQEPNSSTWVSFSTALNPSKIFNKKGTWDIRLTVSDGTASHSITKSLTVLNRAPIANFSWSPTTIYNDTNVTFSNSSTDADKDSLTYQWAYQEPNSSTWVNFSTTANPSKVFNKKGTWNIRLTVSDGTASHSVTKSLTVLNRAPVANFSWSPSTIYNDTTVTFSNSSSDADKDSLTYKWEYQEPNSTTWVSFSTAVNPTKILNKQEVWKIRLTVSDGTASHSVTKSITVLNRTPLPNFSATPNPTDRLTTVTFTNTSSDPDKDTLTYVWEYRIKGTTTWTKISTSTNTSFKFPKVATYEVRLTASDKWVSASKTLDVIVKNIKPVVELTYELPNSPLPNEVWEGDTVKVCAKVTDAENDPMTVKIFIKKDGGTNQLVLEKSNLTSGSRPCYTFVTEVGRYDITVTVNDGYDEITTSTWFNSKDLILVGYVKHTPDWEVKHNELGHAPHQFYSGERFLLESDVSPYPVESLTSTFSGSQSNSLSVTRLVNLSKVSNILYKGELYDKLFLEYPTNLKVGPASFLFKVKYVNGVIEEYTVPIEIIADGFEQYRIHRKY